MCLPDFRTTGWFGTFQPTLIVALLPEMNAISLSPLTPMTSIQQRTPVFSADPKKFIIILMRSAAATEMTSSPTIN